ncbi:MAG TPA: hypothetical protein VFX28_09305, partial [Methylomirabilota bacterium]|nr:hypothetical protein [Methylomirabilota bacterium]
MSRTGRVTAGELAPYRRNVRILVWMQGLRMFHITVPVLAPFLLANGLPKGDIFLLEGAFALVLMLWDAPSGYVADLWGRRRCLLAGDALQLSAMLLFATGHEFTTFLVAEVLSAISYGLVSGSDAALLYDSLAVQGRAGEYQRLESIAIVRGRLGEGLASIVAAALLWRSAP